MYEFGRILEHVVDALNDIPFAQHDFVPKRHQSVFHVGLYSCHYMDSVFEKSLEKPWRDISPIGKEPSVQFLCQHIPYFRIPVVHISSCEAEGYDFPTVIAGEMQLEVPLKTLLAYRLRLWQTGIIVLSTKLMPVHLPKA